MSARVLPPAAQGVGSVNVAGQISGLHGTPSDRGHNGRHWQASSMIEGGRCYTLRCAAGQVAFAFWGGIDWKPLAFAKGFARASGEGRFGG